MLKTNQNIYIIKFAFLIVVFCNVVVDVAHKVLLQNIAFKVFDGSEQVVWISIINAMIIIPFLLLFSISGFLSDRYNKKDILIYGAISSFTLSVLMVLSYLSGNFYLAMLNLTLLAVQSAIYSPAKFGIIMDIWGKGNLAKGNSSLQAVSIIAILFSIASGSYFFESFYDSNVLQTLQTKEELLLAILPLTYYIVPVAFLEMLLSLLVLRRLNTNYSFDNSLVLDKNKLLRGELLKKNIKMLFSNNLVSLSVVGLSVFWGISQGLMAVFPSYAKEYLNITDVFVINGVLAASGIGIALGSIIYSKLSKHYIEIGTIPLAALGMALMIFCSTVVESSLMLSLTFLLFGVFGGMFVVPLNALIQFNAKRKTLGTILAGNNWFHSLAMFIMLCLTTVVSYNNLNPLSTIYLILFITIVGMAYTIYSLPQSMILLFVKIIVGLKYKLDVQGLKNIPSNGGALLLGNHVSWIDWAVVFMSSPRQIRFVMHKPIYEKWYLTWILKLFNVIPISNSSSKQTIKTIAKCLDDGDIVVLFPEGSITRTGHLGEFKRGFELILKQTKEDIPVIAFYIRGLWESMFSRANRKYKSLRRIKSVTVSFSKPIKKEEATASKVKQVVKELSSKSWREHTNSLGTIQEVVFDRLKEMKTYKIFADTTGLEVSAYKFLTAITLFKNILKTKLQGEHIGLLLPSSVGGAFINCSVLMLGKVAINLNFTSSMQTLAECVKKAEIKSLITSKKFVEKLIEKGIKIDEVLSLCDVIYVEDMKKEITKTKGIITLISIVLLPSFILKAIHLKKVNKDSTAVIMFSSGSEGVPKGVELTHSNIIGNSKQIASVINANEDDIIVGSLPLFHAFGTVVTMFLPLIEGITCVAHPDPTDGYAIGKLVEKYKATIILGTSTFFRLYAKNPKVKKEMFSSLRLVVAGAEKLSQKVREDFEKRFDKNILEGFGTTETTPVACCNLPNIKTSTGEFQLGSKIGTVGMPIPGTKIKIVDPSTFNELKVGEEGMILISGVQVMKGYLKDEKRTKEAIIEKNGEKYYITGDKGRLDSDGFLTIVDRYSRFAKLGGEMVSLGLVEEKIKALITNDEIDVVVTAINDEKKGEKIVALLSHISSDELEILKNEVKESFDNNLMLPSEYKIVEEVPKLGSGKTDFSMAKKVAMQLM
ncbi:acyl-[ACP]--phospholipid O-acyltransferase [Halarcobacter ebronensis]|uniref:Acyl-[ACP]--phospholipid O-acyltransferase n=1 Tax=Halarcobacter ebronensis TaxID=1462615 RepID=A0A4Q0YC34_9BACT|nr:acyl-[ACP]--phospholipid O-acyltransferase [Halarcobacter ebronensis]RXJ67114.1 acyl-[ACP]--phospholipid O-acyltransferase [Halarcobacter ebronensis]